MKTKRNKRTRRAKEPTLEVREYIEESCDWTPASSKVHPRGVCASFGSGSSAVSVSISEWGGDAKLEGSVYLAINAQTVEDRGDAEFSDPVSVSDLGRIVKALVTPRPSGRGRHIAGGQLRVVTFLPGAVTREYNRERRPL